MFIFGASKESGWRIPFDGDIDKNLRVTAGPADELEDFKLELRWEFLASPEGASPEDWQPMKQDMNDVLEKRWAKHWDGDDGTDFFNVESNGFTYRIDCYTMYQENLKTYRCRRIRRGEPRASMAAVLPKLMAKDAEIARLQAQNSDLFKELDKLDDKVRRLECLGIILFIRGVFSSSDTVTPGMCFLTIWGSSNLDVSIPGSEAEPQMERCDGTV